MHVCQVFGPGIYVRSSMSGSVASVPYPSNGVQRNMRGGGYYSSTGHPSLSELCLALAPVTRVRPSQPDSDRLCRGRLTVRQRHRIDCLLAIDLALVVAAVTDKSLLSGSKAGYVATTWPCACASERYYHWFTWVRPMVQLANSLALRKANWNRERTMMI